MSNKNFPMLPILPILALMNVISIRGLIMIGAKEVMETGVAPPRTQSYQAIVL